jgi:hypothetical protein
MRLLALAAVLCAATVGCGYVDDNPRAAQVVAQAYLDAYTDRDLATVCRVLAPEIVLAVSANRPSCEAGISTLLTGPYPPLTVGSTREAPSPPGNPRLFVSVREQPGRMIELGRYGSIWRVINGGTPP